jgi:hypothetical protein
VKQQIQNLVGGVRGERRAAMKGGAQADTDTAEQHERASDGIVGANLPPRDPLLKQSDEQHDLTLVELLGVYEGRALTGLLDGLV